jgi:hypothetical protein
VVTLTKHTLLEGSRTNAGSEQVAKPLAVEHQQGFVQGGVIVSDTNQIKKPFQYLKNKVNNVRLTFETSRICVMHKQYMY